MKTARVYKDNMREGIIRSMIFTDKVIFIASVVVTAGLTYLFYYTMGIPVNWGVFIGVVIFFNLTLFFFLTMKRDNQPMYILIPRAIMQLFVKKQTRGENMESQFKNFHIQDNTVFHKNHLLRIYAVEPFDISLLSNHDKEHFYENLRQMIHLLPSKVQFLVRRERARPEDYSEHFFSLYNGSDGRRTDLINDYID